jgi:hypothetical protein
MTAIKVAAAILGLCAIKVFEVFIFGWLYAQWKRW